MANYEVDPAVLQRFLPAATELDSYKGSTYVSLVGFMFREVRVRGLLIPFHTHFPEVNLRFYVRFKEGNEWKRGVVFISEIVPRPAITWVANTLFREHYISLPSPLTAGSKEEFITEHFWGYATAGRGRTWEYQVAHPRWDIYGVEQYKIDCDFGGLYGPGFSELATRIPESVFLAEGSAISVYTKRGISISSSPSTGMQA